MNPLVLSIQSHVVHGVSGNRSAVLPLEVNGITTDPLNTVHFSTHTGYQVVRGTKMSISEFDEIINGLRSSNILGKYTHILSGYIGDPHIIDGILKLRNELGKQVHYYCDPVLGDWGEFYVSPECLEIIKTKLVPVANTVSPNTYEAEWITGIKMDDQSCLINIVDTLHKMGPENVIITSTEWKRRIIFFSFEYGKERIAIETPSLDRKFDGPGDLFSALLLSNLINYPGEYTRIAERTVNSVFGVLSNTVQLKSNEISMAQSVRYMMDPPNQYKAMSIEEFFKLDINPK